MKSMRVISTQHPDRWAIAVLPLLCGVALLPCSSQANVFASNLQLNNTATNLITSPGDGVTISYLLNQNADLGVNIGVAQGTNVLWSTNIISGATNRGAHSIVWDGRDSFGNTVSNGLWRVRVTAASAGRTNWWKVPVVDNSPVNPISVHGGEGYVYSPWGLAVNNNTNSRYFGRIFVGSSLDSGNGFEAGDYQGIAKYNADGSYAAEGPHCTGGWVWNDILGADESGQSPGKMEVGADDRLYVVDRVEHRATVLSFDQVISTSAPPVLALNNDALFVAGQNDFSGLAIAGMGTNRFLFMTDIGDYTPGGLGIRRWTLGTNGTAATNDTGVTVVAAGPGLDLDNVPQDVAITLNGGMVAIQKLSAVHPSPKILGFNPYQGNTITNAAWKVFSSPGTNALEDAFAVAAALHTNWIAVACFEEVHLGKPLTVYDISATNAVLLTENGDGLNPDGQHQFTDVAWDRAGNLYTADQFYLSWRVYSPPGANSFTTTSLQSIKVGPYLQPILRSPRWQTNQFQVQLQGEIGVQYALELSTNLTTWTSVATNTAMASLSPWTLPSASSRAFIRARVLP